jgi:hypothetical protein
VQISGLAANVCFLSLQQGKSEEALLQLEAGRALLLGYILDDHDELDELTRGHSGLAQRFKELRSKLRTPYDSPGFGPSELKMREHAKAQAAISKCLDEIR